QATQAAPVESAAAEAADHPTPALLGASRDAASVRNVTVLPQIEISGEAVRIKPRTEARYQRIQHLGRGGMGEGTLMQDNDIGRPVAVKQLLKQAQHPADLARFIAEIRTIGRLEHPNIVPIHDVGVDTQGQLFFVMKHIDGETLEAVIDKLKSGDPEYLMRY